MIESIQSLQTTDQNAPAVYVQCADPKLFPSYGSTKAAGLDIRADKDYTLRPGQAPELIGTGVFLSMPDNLEAQVRPRSGLSLQGLIVCNSPGTVDPDYTGEIKVIARCAEFVSRPIVIKYGERIAQLVFSEIARPKIVSLEAGLNIETVKQVRGPGGFGSTGR